MVVWFEGKSGTGDTLVGDAQKGEKCGGEEPDASGQSIEEEGEEDDVPGGHDPDADEFDG